MQSSQQLYSAASMNLIHIRDLTLKLCACSWINRSNNPCTGKSDSPQRLTAPQQTMATGQHVQQHAHQNDIQQATELSAQQALLLFVNTQNYFCNGKGPIRQAAVVQQLQVGRTTICFNLLSLCAEQLQAWQLVVHEISEDKMHKDRRADNWYHV